MEQYNALAVDSTAFAAGRTLGGIVTTAQGTLEAGAGITAVGGGGLFCTTGVGCVLGGGEAVVAGSAVLVHGTSAALAGAAEAGQQANILFAKGSKYGEPPTGRRGSFSRTTKDELDQQYDGVPCPLCGNKSSSMDTDHIVPYSKTKLGAASRGEEIDRYNDVNNLARICPACNRSKQDTSLLQFLANLFTGKR
jgi:hypothetical protein